MLITVILSEDGRFCTGEVCRSLSKQSHREIQQIVRDGEKVRGEAVMWLGSNDRFDAEYLERMVAAIRDGADLVYSDLMVHCRDAIRMVPLPDFSEEKALAGRFALAPFAVKTKHIAGQLRPPPELWLNVSRNKGKIARIPDLYYHRQVDASRWVKCAEEFAREVQLPVMQMRRWAAGV